MSGYGNEVNYRSSFDFVIDFPVYTIIAVAHVSTTTDLSFLNEPPSFIIISHQCKINVPSHYTDKDFYMDEVPYRAPQHRTYTVESEVMVIHDRTFILKYDGIEDMTTTLQHLHMSDLLNHDNEGVDDNGPNDIEYSQMLPCQTNEDFLIGGSPELQQRLEVFFQYGHV